jgi:PilZ domain
MPKSVRSPRVDRVLDVTIQDCDDYPKLVRLSKTVNLSRSGLLMHVPLQLDAAPGEDIVVRLRWSGGTFESPGRIVRFESPYGGDATRSVMGIALARELPPALLIESTSGAVEAIDAA